MKTQSKVEAVKPGRPSEEAEIFKTQEEAKQYLLQNKSLWERLVTMISLKTDFYQWKCYFRYRKITILTQAASVVASQQLNLDASSAEFWEHSIADEFQLEQ